MNSSAFLLDAGGAFLLVIPVAFVLFMTGIIFLEAWVLYFFKYEKFKRCLRDSMLVNLVSLVAGFICMFFLKPADIGMTPLFFIFFALTLLSEGGMLLLLKKGQPVRTILLATVIMNVLSYLILALIFLLPSLL